MKELNVNATGFLWPEEEKLFKHVMKLMRMQSPLKMLNEAPEGILFSPYIIPTVPHSPWEYRNIPYPWNNAESARRTKVKMEAGVYEQSQSSYRSRWFVVLKRMVNYA